MYQNLINKDRDASRKRWRSVIEHAMAYMKPEVLEKVLRQRRNEEESENSKDVFEKQIADTFGKPLQASG